MGVVRVGCVGLIGLDGGHEQIGAFQRRRIGGDRDRDLRFDQPGDNDALLGHLHCPCAASEQYHVNAGAREMGGENGPERSRPLDDDPHHCR